MLYLKRTGALLLLILFPLVWVGDLFVGYKIKALRVGPFQSARDILRAWKINYWEAS